MNWVSYVLLGFLGLSIGLNFSLWKICKMLKSGEVIDTDKY